jgi:CRISPR/Cas system CSM-associated protein Csm4 (group 5 of RAMP superfamily)
MDNVYIITDGRAIKIGRSKNVDARLATLQTAVPNKLEVLCIIKSKSASRIERALHRQFKDNRLEMGEWFMIEKKEEYIKEAKRLANTMELLMEENTYLKNGGKF